MELVTRESVEEKVMVMLEEAMALPAGSKERSTAIEDISKLIHSINEEDRNTNEYAVKCDQLAEQRKDREKDEKKNRWSNWLTVSGLSLGFVDLIKDVVCYLWGLNFEEGGTITSPHLRQNINKLFRKHEVPKKIY